MKQWVCECGDERCEGTHFYDPYKSGPQCAPLPHTESNLARLLDDEWDRQIAEDAKAGKAEGEGQASEAH